MRQELQGSKLKIKSSRFWQLRTRNVVPNSQVLVAIWYVLHLNYVVYFDLVANLVTAWKLLVTSQTILVAMATVLVTILSPELWYYRAVSKPGGQRLTKLPPWSLWLFPLKRAPIASLAYSSQQITWSSKSFWEDCGNFEQYCETLWVQDPQLLYKLFRWCDAGTKYHFVIHRNSVWRPCQRLSHFPCWQKSSLSLGNTAPGDCSMCLPQ